MLVVLAKFCTAHQLGEFALALAVSAPVFLLGNLQLRSVQATDARREYHFGHYLGLRLLTNLLALVAIAGLACWAGYSGATLWVVLLVALAKSLEALSDVLYGLLQQHERLDWVARSMILKGILSVGLLTLAVMFSGSLLWGAFAMVGASAGVLALYDVPLGLRVLGSWNSGSRSQEAEAWGRRWAVLAPRFPVRTLGRLAWLSLPLGLIVMLGSLSSNLPRYFIESQLGTAKLGVYAALAAVFSGLYFVQTAVGHAALPRLARDYAAGRMGHYLRVSGIVLASGLVNSLLAMAVACVGGSWLLRLIYSEEFAGYQPLFVWLAVASAAQCLSGALAYFLQAARCFRQIAWVSLVNTLVVLGCCAWFIPVWGELGGAYAVLAGSAASSVILVIQFVLLLRSSREEPYASRSVVPAARETSHVPHPACLAPGAYR